MVQENALIALASVADLSQEHFQNYYHLVMPSLKTILVNANDEFNRMLRSQVVECISLIMMAVGKDKFGDDAKQNACQLLRDYVDELHEDFYPWIDQATLALVLLLKLNFHEECRIAAISALLKMLRSAKVAVEKGIAQGRNETYVKQLSDYIMPALLEALHKETDTELCLGMLQKVNKCLKISVPLLDEGQVRRIADEIKKVLSDSLNRKREQAERTKSEDFDSEEFAEDFDAEESDLNYEEFELEEDIFHYVGKILSVLIETFKAAFLPFFDELSSYLMPMWSIAMKQL